MMNVIWLSLLVIGIAVGIATDNMDGITRGILKGAEDGVAVCLGLISILVFWLGLMKIAEQAGLVQLLAKALKPIARFLYPSVPINHPAMGSILANMSANILGLGNAATPLGLKAMQELQTLNPHPDRASDAMCTLLAINTASLTIIPATVIGWRMQYGSDNPTEIVGATILATFLGTTVAVLLDRTFRAIDRKRRRE
ncbi:nucleoside recognition domain-containing protein [Effusibacillus lacus]|uniref:Spore maturation protein n=1 Tax=Effusibacillus lacus TaxID=1348429 RepID=A0A292YSD4_9BACL|nr:nucleoside recognition domain-containing protein [Effusibacillus lacus]TCS76291.1 spore maturation protein A [Effusibacillus lacus]GAX91839.1 spore maturation protein [Effusibacillus lacus]